MYDEYVYARGSIKCWFQSDGEKLGTHAVALVTLTRECGGITVKASNVKTKPNLEDLMANTDFEAQRNDPHLQAWANKHKNGRENS